MIRIPETLNMVTLKEPKRPVPRLFKNLFVEIAQGRSERNGEMLLVGDTYYSMDSPAINDIYNRAKMVQLEIQGLIATAIDEGMEQLFEEAKNTWLKETAHDVKNVHNGN